MAATAARCRPLRRRRREALTFPSWRGLPRGRTLLAPPLTCDGGGPAPAQCALRRGRSGGGGGGGEGREDGGAGSSRHPGDAAAPPSAALKGPAQPRRAVAGGR